MLRLLLLGPFTLERDPPANGPPDLSKPKLVALLSYLAAASPRAPRSRDTLLGLFWPERDEASARHALRQSLFELRQSLGDDVLDNRRGDVIALGPDVWSDVAAFRAACESKADTEALVLYRGELLSGFLLADAPDFEQWLSDERRALRAEACLAATRLADAAEAGGDLAEAAMRLAQATELAPYNEVLYQRRLRLLDRLGDRAGALITYERLVARLQSDLGTAPAPETQLAIDRIRRRGPVKTHERDEPPAAAMPAAHPTLVASNSGTPRNRRWMRWGSIAALLVLGGTAIGHLRHGPPPLTTVIAEPVAGDSEVAHAVRTALRIDLVQSGAIAPAGEEMVADARRHMRRDTGALDVAVAREVAIREGQSAVLVAGVERLGARYLLSAQVLDAASGAELSSARAVAADSNALIDATAELSRTLRGRMARAGWFATSHLPLDRVTTSSLEALRMYSRADGSNPARNVTMLKEALALDSTFAMAWWRLATIYRPWGSQSQYRDAVERAWALRRRLPEPDRTIVEAAHARLSGDLDRARALMEELLVARPEEPEALTILTDMHMRRGEFEVAERYARRGRRGVDRYNAVVVAAAQGHYIAASALLDTMGADSSVFPHRLRGELVGSQGLYDSAVACLRRYVDKSLDFRGDRAGGRATIALVEEIRGRVDEASRWIVEDIAEGNLQAPTATRRVVWLSRLDLRYRGDTAGALRRLERQLTLAPLSAMPAIDRPYNSVAALYREAGRDELARAYWLLQQRVAPDTTSVFWQTAKAGLESLAGRHASAARRLEVLTRARWPEGQSQEMWPVAYEWDLAGQADSALAWYRRASDAPGMRKVVADAPWLARSLERMADLYLRAGHPDSAAATTRRLLQLWAGADPALRARLAPRARFTSSRAVAAR